MRRALHLAVALLGAVTAARAQNVLPVREGDPVERAAAFWRERAWPWGEGGAEENRSAVQAARLMGWATVPGSASFFAAVGPWRAVGPFGFQVNAFFGSSPQSDGGRITSIAIHPLNPRDIYVGSASGGVWRTTNGGASWAPLSDAQCSLTVGALALDPIDPTIVYVGTGEPTQSFGCGLLRSFDGGSTWTEITGGGVLAPTTGTGNYTYRIVVDKGTAGSRTSTVVLDATLNGLFRSTNSGTAWTLVLAGRVTDLRADPVQAGTYWAAVSTNNLTGGLYKSTDRGATWGRVVTSPTGNGRTALAVSPANPRKVWMAVSDATTNRMGTVFMYDDATSAVSTLSATGLYGVTSRGDFGAQSSYDLVLEADPTVANTIYLGGTRIYRSRDGGQSFTVVAYFTHVDWHAFEFAPSDPTVIVGGNDGGVHASYDRGETWVSRNTNIAVTQFYHSLGVHPTIADVIVGGLQDNSTLFGSGSMFWSYVSGGDGGASIFNPANPNVIWSTCQNFGCIYRSTRVTSGNGFSVFQRGFNGSDRKRFLPPLVIDPNTPSTLYYGTYRLYVTTNEGSGSAWVTLSGDLTKGAGVINTITVAPSDPRVIWVGTSDGNIALTQDAGVSFSQVAIGLPNRSVSKIGVDPLDARRALITFFGFGTSHVFFTSNLGASWTDVSAGLPDLPFNAAVILPGSNRFFVAGDIGIYESQNAGATWASSFPGMPNVIVTDLVYQATTGNLYAGTYGRGIFATNVAAGPALLRGDVSRDGVVNAFDALLVQQALVGAVPANGQNPTSAGDANCNGRIDSGDVLGILQFAVGAAPASLCVGKVQ